MQSRMRGRRLGGLGVAVALGVATAVLPAQAPGAQDALPFGIGERLTFEIRAGGIGGGTGEMWVEGPVEVRGITAWILNSRMKIKVGPFGATSTSKSWIDPERMTSLRFEKRERHLLSRHADSVEIYPSEGRWTDDDGESGLTDTPRPLDELSFIYFLRTLPLLPGQTLTFDRHYDVARNPVVVQVLGRDTLETPAGTIPVIEVEMRVRDPRHYRGEGVIRLAFSDDARRSLVRLESTAPAVGTVVLTLASRSGGAGAAELRAATPEAVAGVRESRRLADGAHLTMSRKAPDAPPRF